MLDASSDFDTHHTRIDETTGEAIQRHVRGTSWLTFDSGEQARLTVERGIGTMEFSVPRLARGHNVEAATIEETWQIVEQAHTLATDHVEWAHPVEGLIISRVDLPCDFLGVEEPALLLDTMSHTRPPRMKSVTGWSTARGTQTLTHQVNRRWRASLYDKEAEYVSRHREPDPVLLAVAKGRLRFEPQLRRPTLAERNVRTLADLTEECAVALAEHYFQRCQFHLPVRVDTSLRDLHERYPSPIKELNAILMMQTWARLGLDDGYSPETRRKYRKLAEAHGIRSVRLGEGLRNQVRLDFTTRTLVTAA